MKQQYVDTLLEVARGAGGRKVLITGAPAPGQFYWAGWQFQPVTTLLEAVLRCLLSGNYERIIAFTGQSASSLLPHWNLSGGVPVGGEPLVWVVSGKQNERPVPATPITKVWERQRAAAPPLRILKRGAQRPYWDRLEEFIVTRDRELAGSRQNQQRLAIVLDFAYVAPSGPELDLFTGRAPLDLFPQTALTISRHFETRPETLGPADLVVFSEDSQASLLLQESGDFLERYCSSTIPDEWQRSAATVAAALPRITLGASTTSVVASRSAFPLTTQLDRDAVLKRDADLYQVLTTSRLSSGAVSPGRPPHPERVWLEFWAGLDLTPLRQAFERDIIGQETAKNGILGRLERYSQRCRRLLAGNPTAEKTSRHADFLPPIVGLFGAAGMGKTTFCKTIGDFLFGTAEFSRILDMSGRIAATEIVGVSPPYAGYDSPSSVMEFAAATGGLGVLCFDEFTRMLLPDQQTIANALSPFLQLTAERLVEPANAKLRPAGGHYHLANTLFVFSANVSEPGQQEEGFVRFEELGAAFDTRIRSAGDVFYFEYLKTDQYRGAIERAIRIRLATEVNDLYEDLRPRLAGAVITPELLEALTSQFSDVVARGSKPSLRVVASQVRNKLLLERALDGAREQPDREILLGTEVLS